MKFRIILKSYNSDLIEIGCKNVYSTLLPAGCKISGVVSLPIRIKRFCVLRSPHVDKDSREHFEIRLFKRFIDITSDSTEIFEFLLKINLPSGISSSLKVLKS